MINIFDRKTSYKEALISNGVYDLTKMMISAETTEDIYGNYELNMEIELQGDAPTELYEMLQVDNIVKVNDEGSEELFRIAQVNKGLDFIEVYCRHITISDSLNLWLDNVKPTNLSGGAALQWINSRTNPNSELILSSNIAKVASANYVRKNLYQALFEDENAFIKRWGGEVKRTRQTITINGKLGQDKSDKIIIKEALNLTEFNAKSNIDEVSTVIYPVGFDGITAPRVESPLINNYSMEFPIEIKYEDVKVKKKPEEGQPPSEQEEEGYDTLEEAQAELTRRAKAEFETNHLDRIKFECDIDYIDLEKYEEYKDITALQTAFLGDVIAVRVDTFDMDIKARVVARKHDVLRNKRLENTISTEGTLKKPDSIKDIIKDIIGGEEFPEIWEGLGPYVDQMIQAGFKNGYLVYEKNACYAVDQLPKEKARNVVVLNKNGLGYSSNGIGGPYTYGFTIDGKLNADMITTGTLHGQYIGAGTIEANKLTVAAKKEITKNNVTKTQFNNLTSDVEGLTSTVGRVEQTVNGQNSTISKIEQKADKIELSVQDKVGKNDVISSINLSKEGIKIKASKLEVTGDFVTKSDLTDGVTVISGDNIQTGTIHGMRFLGTESMYMAAGGVMSCDGETYIKDLSIPETHPSWNGTGRFWCGAGASFDKDVKFGSNNGGGQPLVKGANGFMGVIRRDKNAWIEVDRLAIQSGSSTYLEIPGYQSNHVYGVDLWYSDKALKRNINKIDSTNPQPLTTRKIGLELIKNIEHYNFDYVQKNDVKTEEGTTPQEKITSVECGYISQDLAKHNDQLTQAITQGDGSTLLSPRPSFIIPNITLAIQEQQKIIEIQQGMIEKLEARIAALEAKQNV